MTYRGLRVLHGVTPTGGQAWGLAQAERRLGLESTVVYSRNNVFAYPCDIDLALYGAGRWKVHCQYLTLFGRALAGKDVIHLNFGSPLLSYARLGLYGVDLPIYRLAGRRLVVTFNGSDARQTTICRAAPICSAQGYRHCACGGPALDRGKGAQIAKIQRYADHVFVLNPDLLRVVPGADFLPYVIPDFDSLLSVPSPRAGSRKFRILHAPSRRLVKGTALVLQAVQRLRQHCPNVELVLVENQSYRCVRDMLPGVDLVIDQLVLGWYGALAVESMAAAIPVVCFVRNDDLEVVPAAMRADIEATVLNADVGSLYRVLQAAVESKSELVRRGKRAREFVVEWHNPAEVARRVVAHYTG